MKILFFWLDIGSGHKSGVNHGLAWISSYLKSQGHQVSCQQIKDKFNSKIAIKAVKDKLPDCVGFSLTTNQRHYLDDYARVIRQCFNGLMIAGGVGTSLDPNNVLACPCIDGVCIGEGEYPLAILGQNIDKRISHYETPSFWWKHKNGKGEIIIKNELIQFERNLSKFPFPDYSIFSVEKIQAGLSGFANIMISRGCPYSCTYCCNNALKSIYKNKDKYFRILPSEYAIALLDDYKQKFPATKGFIFEDDLLLCNTKWFLKFAQEYQKKIGLPYICNSRFEFIQNEEIINVLKESGCIMVTFGLESGDEQFRKKLLKRRYTNENIFNAIRLCNKVDLAYFTYNIFGFPFETKEQMEKTFIINKAIRPHSGQAFFFYPYPNTELYELCVKHKLLIPEKMKEVSGYREKPVIKLTNYTEKDCMKIQNRLMLYFIARRFSRLFRINRIFIDILIHKTLMIYPTLFINLFTKENIIRNVLRKLQYKFW